jgi:outer membrane receptor protein involved in Fe transport
MRQLVCCALAALPLAAPAQDQQDQQAPVPPAVVVPGTRATVVKQLDKTVYDVTGLARAANGSAQDVLQATPEVSVTADGRIAVKGNAQVTILIDGKPTAMLAGDAESRAVALQTMSGADIASVEVITNPSAAYRANGGAIVNIVLKHNRAAGAHGQLQASVADRGLWQAGASADATGARFGVHGSLALRQDGTEKQRASTVDWSNPTTGQSGQSGQTSQSSQVFIRRAVASATLGVDYAPADNQSVSLSTTWRQRKSQPLFDVFNTQREDGTETKFHHISYGANQQLDRSASLAYSRQDPGAAFKAMFQHSGTTTLVDKSYRDVFLDAARATAYSRGATSTARRLNQATVDWSGASTRGQWGAGLAIDNQADDTGNYQAAVDPATGSATPDPATTNGYTVATTLTAAYVTDKIVRGKWEVLLGARAERLVRRVRPVSVAHGADYTDRSHAYHPSLHLRYAHSDRTDFTVSYRRSLQQPDPRDLSPYTTYIDAQNLARGNPVLGPQRLRSLEIGADTQARQLSGSWNAFYRSSRATVTDARSLDGNVLVTSRQNGGQARSAGVTASLDWTPRPGLRLGVDGGIYRVQLATPDLDTLVRQAGMARYVNARAAWTVGAEHLALDAHGQSAAITALGRTGSTSSVNVTWKHQLSGVLSLTVNASDIFDGSRRTYATDTRTFRQTGYDHFVARRVYLGLVRKFD